MRCIRIRFSAVDHESWRSTGRIRRHGPQECWRPWGCVQAGNGSWTGGECDGPDCRWCGGCRGASHGCSAPTVSDAWNTEQTRRQRSCWGNWIGQFLIATSCILLQQDRINFSKLSPRAGRRMLHLLCRTAFRYSLHAHGQVWQETVLQALFAPCVCETIDAVNTCTLSLPLVPHRIYPRRAITRCAFEQFCLVPGNWRWWFRCFGEMWGDWCPVCNPPCGSWEAGESGAMVAVGLRRHWTYHSRSFWTSSRHAAIRAVQLAILEAGGSFWCNPRCGAKQRKLVQVLGWGQSARAGVPCMPSGFGKDFANRRWLCRHVLAAQGFDSAFHGLRAMWGDEYGLLHRGLVCARYWVQTLDAKAVLWEAWWLLRPASWSAKAGIRTQSFLPTTGASSTVTAASCWVEASPTAQRWVPSATGEGGVGGSHPGSCKLQLAASESCWGFGRASKYPSMACRPDPTGGTGFAFGRTAEEVKVSGCVLRPLFGTQGIGGTFIGSKITFPSHWGRSHTPALRPLLCSMQLALTLHIPERCWRFNCKTFNLPDMQYCCASFGAKTARLFGSLLLRSDQAWGLDLEKKSTFYIH